MSLHTCILPSNSHDNFGTQVKNGSASYQIAKMYYIDSAT